MGKRGPKRKRGRGIRGALSLGYKILGTVNTLATVGTGDLGKIGKHVTRRATVKLGGRLI